MTSSSNCVCVSEACYAAGGARDARGENVRTAIVMTIGVATVYTITCGAAMVGTAMGSRPVYVAQIVQLDAVFAESLCSGWVCSSGSAAMKAAIRRTNNGSRRTIRRMKHTP